MTLQHLIIIPSFRERKRQLLYSEVFYENCSRSNDLLWIQQNWSLKLRIVAFLAIGPNRPLFVYFRPFLNTMSNILQMTKK